MNNRNGEVVEKVISSLRLFYHENEVPDKIIEHFSGNTISAIEIYCNRQIGTRPQLIESVLIPIVKKLIHAWREVTKEEPDWRDMSIISEEGSSVNFKSAGQRALAEQILSESSADHLENYKPILRQNRRLM